MDPLHLDVMMREILHTLGNIDFAAEVELDQVETRILDPNLKEDTKGKIRAALREKRRSYMDLLERLRGQ